MPMDWSKYPKNWREISSRIRFERAKGRCEWCDAPHDGWRDKTTGVCFEPDFAEWFPHMTEDMTRIILTVAHLGKDKPDGTPGDKRDTMDCREDNLAALCQRCHLNFDREQHLQKRMHNRRRAVEAAGQQRMF